MIRRIVHKENEANLNVRFNKNSLHFINSLLLKLFMKIEKFLNRSPIVPILVGSRYLESELKRGLRESGLGIWEALVVIAILFEERACQPRELAKFLNMSRSQLSQSLSRLVKEGLVRRELASHDARGIYLSITSRGRRAALDAVKIFSSVNSSIESGMSEDFSERMAGQLFNLFFKKGRRK